MNKWTICWNVFINGWPWTKGADDDNEEEIDDPLNKFRAPTNETCLQSVLPDYPATLNIQQISHPISQAGMKFSTLRVKINIQFHSWLTNIVKNWHFQYYFQMADLVTLQRNQLIYHLQNISMHVFHTIVAGLQWILNICSLHSSL